MLRLGIDYGGKFTGLAVVDTRNSKVLFALFLSLLLIGCASKKPPIVEQYTPVAPIRQFNVNAVLINVSDRSRLIVDMTGPGIGILRNDAYDTVTELIVRRLKLHFPESTVRFSDGNSLAYSSKADLAIYFDAQIQGSNRLRILVRGVDTRFNEEVFAVETDEPFQLTRTKSGGAPSMCAAMLTLGVGGLAVDDQYDKSATEATFASFSQTLSISLDRVSKQLFANDRLAKYVANRRIVSPEPIPSSRETAEKREPSKYDDYFRSVIIVRTNSGSGTGFFISPSGFALTNYHVVGSDDRPFIKTYDGLTTSAKVVARDSICDIALLKVNVEDAVWLPIDGGFSPGIGSDVIAIGSPLTLDYTVSKGIVSAKRIVGNFLYIQTDAAINVGNSGGPLISLDDGKVVGIVTFGVKKNIAEGLNFALSTREIAQFIKQHLD